MKKLACKKCGSTKLIVLKTSREPEGIRPDRECLNCGALMSSHRFGFVLLPPAPEKPKDTVPAIQRRLRRELKRIDGLLTAHCKKYDCKIDGTCLARGRYHGYIAALETALSFTKGTEPEGFTFE